MPYEPEAGQPDPWERSSDCSLGRRAAGAARSFARRRRARRAAAALTLPAVLALSGGVGLAAGTPGPKAGAAPALAAGALLQPGSSGPLVARLQRALGVGADGVYGSRTAAAVRRFQRRRGLAVDGVAGPATLAAAGVGGTLRRSSARTPLSGKAPPPAPVPASAVLERIAACESGGDPRRVSADGRYRGKYQFSPETWRALGGSGDPAQASEAEQDRRAAQLLAERGTSPWPSCS